MGALAAQPLLSLDDRYARELEELVVPWRAARAAEPRLLVLNEALAAALGADAGRLRTPEGVALLLGEDVPDGARPVAMAYSGHQFGTLSPRLGDGRALLLGEVVDADGRLWDVHLKGSGRTPFARGGDGKAAVGPMLREHLVSEAMFAMGIPTTRSLAVVATGEDVVRETILPGAVLVRVAASHIRVGTFEYAALRGDREVLQRLADHAIARHYPDVAGPDAPYLAFFERVVEAQASLIARWLAIGFVHGVMNTDNMAISGETIDYGPCAFMEAYDPATVFSSIDHGGRYAYGNQPIIGQWNLARLAEAMLPLLGPEPVEAATAILDTFPDRLHRHWLAGMRAKLALDGADPGDDELFTDLLTAMHGAALDYTSTFRALSASLRGDTARVPAPLVGWAERWRDRMAGNPRTAADAMDAVNPKYIPRNHLVEEALTAATAGDLAPFERLLAVVTDPFTERPDLERYADPAPTGCGPYVTFCGT
jgi:uncharacterized protein YdiU (UPF0061 family)